LARTTKTGEEYKQHLVKLEKEKVRHRNKPYLKIIRDSRARAKRKNVKFTLTRKWAEQVWTGNCQLTGIPFEEPNHKNAHAYSASVDRIDPDKGYVPENCRFILNCINSFKGKLSDEEVLNLAQALISDSK
jgi:hypothetical protein